VSRILASWKVTGDAAKRAINSAVLALPEDKYFVKICEPTRTLEQNDKIHPTCRAVQKHLEDNGAVKHSEAWWRNYFVAKFGGQEIVPDADGGYVVMNKIHGTSEMGIAEGSDFIEWLYAYGSEIGVDWAA